MGVDLRIYIASPSSENSWWCHSCIELKRDYSLWTRLGAAGYEVTVPESIEVYTYGADGNTRFVLNTNPYDDRITHIEAKKLGIALMASCVEFNRRVGDLLVVLPETDVVVLYWH